MARFARTLFNMFAAGVPLVEALESVAGATGNIVYQGSRLAPLFLALFLALVGDYKPTRHSSSAVPEYGTSS